MNIRTATHSDIPQLTELKHSKTATYRKEHAEAQLHRIEEVEKGKAVYIIAEENAQIYGHIFLRFCGSQTQPDYPNMQDLYVTESQRNKGIGTKLIEKAESITKQQGYTSISLAVNPTLNAKAQALYERLGYTKTNTNPYLDGIYEGVEDWCIDMIKDL